MLKNYLFVALRNLSKRKVHSFINITGLAIGLASFILIFLYVQDEVSYDQYHAKSDRIYRVNSDVKGAEYSSSMAFPVGETLVSDYDNFVEASVRFFNFQAPTVAISYLPDGGDMVRYNEPQFFFTDSTLFDVFDFELLVGDKATALSRPNSLLITESTATKYFGAQDPIGKSIRFENGLTIDFEIVGILADTPKNSHFEFDFLASMSSVFAAFPNANFLSGWYWNPCWTYILLYENANVETFKSFFPDFVEKYWPPQVKDQSEMYLQRLTDIHLTSHLDFEIGPNSDIAYVYIFSGIAIFILIIACINFMNLAIAQSGQRSREVGMRKVLGAARPQLIRQFLSESVLTAFTSVIVALPLVYMTLPVLNTFSGKELSFHVATNPILFGGLLGIGIFVGVVAGLYPAIFLSAFQPVKILKGTLTVGKTDIAAYLRKSLVITQFGISIMLIVGTFVAYSQLDYLRNKDLGFNKEQVILVSILGTPMTAQYPAFKRQLLQDARISNVTALEDVPGSKYQTDSFQLAGQPEAQQFPKLAAHDDFVATLGLELAAGRDFSEEFPSDSATAIMINEAMLPMMNLATAEEALGTKIIFRRQEREIIGVTKNFHYASLHHSIGPFVIERFFNLNFFARYVAVRIPSDDVSGTLASIENLWGQFVPDREFQYLFLDDELDALYESEATLGRIATSFSILAIFVACLGLFGMASFSAERRTKEIGIRKVMGASILGIVSLLSKESALLVFISFILFSPIAYFAIGKWLQSFTYATEINLLSFVAAGLIVLMVSLLTVSLQSLRSAAADPVKSLRYE